MQWVTGSKEHLNRILINVSSNFANASKETILDVICDELNKIPIPFVGSLISKSIRNSFDLYDQEESGFFGIIETLDNMRQSDDDFIRELTLIGVDIEQINTLVQTAVSEVRRTSQVLAIPELYICEPKYLPDHPVVDSKLQFGLMNRGSGAVIASEVELMIVDWAPYISVDFTAPAVQQTPLRLKVKLTPNETALPLLKLNQENPLRFGAFSECAEYMIVQMSSMTNAIYHIRLRIPYTDLSTGEDRELLYPAGIEEPLTVKFSYAPARNADIEPDNILEPGTIVTEVLSAFDNFAGILESESPPDNPFAQGPVNRRLLDAGIPESFNNIMNLAGILPGFSEALFHHSDHIEPYRLLTTLLKFVNQLLRYLPPDYPLQLPDTEHLCEIIDKPELKSQLDLLFSVSDPNKRQKVIETILADLHRVNIVRSTTSPQELNIPVD